MHVSTTEISAPLLPVHGCWPDTRIASTELVLAPLTRNAKCDDRGPTLAGWLDDHIISDAIRIPSHYPEDYEIAAGGKEIGAMEID